VTPLRLNLGSGNEPLAGFVNIDRRAVPGVHVVADVTRLPFAAGRAEGVWASSLLEHFADPYGVLDEIHRVMETNAQLVVRVPALWSYAAHLDPSHLFLADLKLWRQILSGYFASVRADPEGVRYRDSKLLAALCSRRREACACSSTRGLRSPRTQAARDAGVRPWWLEGSITRQQAN
jgi:SAM-dependent methyltransferase